MAPQSTQGIHHLGMTVKDIDIAEDFFITLLGFQSIGGNPDYPAKFIKDSNIMLTLWQVKDQNESVEFNRHKNIGMHHFALKIAEGVTLDEIHRRLSEAKVEIEFAPEPLGKSGLNHMMCYIPGGPRLELIQ